MQTNILWSGREYYSLENCLITTTDTGSKITSTIIGLYEHKIYKVEFQIITNDKWQTTEVEIVSQYRDNRQTITFKGDGKGNWLHNGIPDKRFDGCLDVDIPLTPFTNTLPINRLKLTEGEAHTIKVIYIDLLADTITSVQQKYTCLSDTDYHYENVPNDFEATIKVDDRGFVVDYPQLFVRTTALASNYNTNI